MAWSACHDRVASRHFRGTKLGGKTAPGTFVRAHLVGSRSSRPRSVAPNGMAPAVRPGSRRYDEDERRVGRSRVPTARARAAPRVAFEFLSSLGKPKTGCFLDAADWPGNGSPRDRRERDGLGTLVTTTRAEDDGTPRARASLASGRGVTAAAGIADGVHRGDGGPRAAVVHSAGRHGVLRRWGSARRFSRLGQSCDTRRIERASPRGGRRGRDDRGRRRSFGDDGSRGTSARRRRLVPVVPPRRRLRRRAGGFRGEGCPFRGRPDRGRAEPRIETTIEYRRAARASRASRVPHLPRLRRGRRRGDVRAVFVRRERAGGARFVPRAVVPRDGQRRVRAVHRHVPGALRFCRRASPLRTERARTPSGGRAGEGARATDAAAAELRRRVRPPREPPRGFRNHQPQRGSGSRGARSAARRERRYVHDRRRRRRDTRGGARRGGAR